MIARAMEQGKGGFAHYSDDVGPMWHHRFMTMKAMRDYRGCVDTYRAACLTTGSYMVQLQVYTTGDEDKKKYKMHGESERLQTGRHKNPGLMSAGQVPELVLYEMGHLQLQRYYRRD